MNTLELTDEQHDEAVRLWRFYWKEALRCQGAKAYLAGCVMAASALEAILIVAVDLYSEEAAATKQLPQRGGHLKPLTQWTLADAIKVARAANWLPAGLDRNEEWDHQKAKIGDWAEVIRETRNLVHPGRYMTEWYRKRLTSKNLRLIFEAFRISVDHIVAKINASLWKEIQSQD